MRQGPGPGLFTPHCTPGPCGSAFPAHCMSPPKEDRKELGTLSPEGLISSSGPREASWEHGSWIAAHWSLVTAAGSPPPFSQRGCRVRLHAGHWRHHGGDSNGGKSLPSWAGQETRKPESKALAN